MGFDSGFRTSGHSHRGALQLSRDYFFDVAEPRLKSDFPDVYRRLAVGLAGNGSECFGYDDVLSRDHDWGVDFFIWTLDDDRDHIPKLQEWKNRLLEELPPEFSRMRSEYGASISVMTCGDFYSGLIGTRACPKTLNEWLRAPEEQFAMSVNGMVFIDNPGEFTKTREALLGYYPEDVRRKRIAAKCMALAQTGQYNHERVGRRGDPVTLNTVLSRFTDNAIAMVFLLNKVYRMYYKWAYRALADLPLLGAGAARLLLMIAETHGLGANELSLRQSYIEELCALIVFELNEQGLSDSKDSFLAGHGEAVRSAIKDDFLRSLPPQYEI